MTFQTMCALRIYLRRGDNALPATFWQRLFRRPLATHLLQQSLKAGVTHASLSLGHMGFSRDAKAVSMDVQEIPLATLPVCIELVGPKPLLEQFVRQEAKMLREATLVMLEGVQVSPPVETGELLPAAHRVEYLKADGISLPIDHVAATNPLAAAEEAPGGE